MNSSVLRCSSITQESQPSSHPGACDGNSKNSRYNICFASVSLSRCTGVPAPAGAYIMLMPMVYTFEYGPLKVPGIPLQTLVGAIFVGVGLLMVMTARTFSSKMLIKGPVRARDPHTSHLRSVCGDDCVYRRVRVTLVGGWGWGLQRYRDCQKRKATSKIREGAGEIKLIIIVR